MKIKTKKAGYFFDFDGWVGFGYFKLTGNNQKRELWFLGFVTVEVIYRGDFTGIEETSLSVGLFSRGWDGKFDIIKVERW